MGASGKSNLITHVDNKPSPGRDRFYNVKKPSDITPYEMSKLKTGESLETDYSERKPNITHGDTDLLRNYQIVKGKGDSYIIRWETVTKTGGTHSYTSSVRVSKAGLASYLSRIIKGGNNFKLNYAGTVKELQK